MPLRGLEAPPLAQVNTGFIDYFSVPLEPEGIFQSFVLQTQPE